jgi:DNA-binding transcriptional ArsR family regulator
MTAFDELRRVLEQDPGSLRSDQLLDECFRDAVDAVSTPQNERLSELAATLTSVAKTIFGAAKPRPDIWRIWYAGQLRGIAGVLRTFQGRRLALPATAALLSRKHAKPILRALSTSDSNLTELASKTMLDESQLLRELKVLVRHNLVETTKEGRERWARLTIAGMAALTVDVTDTVNATPAHAGAGNDWANIERDTNVFQLVRQKYPDSELYERRDVALVS